MESKSEKSKKKKERKKHKSNVVIKENNALIVFN